jgi:hypothetical protein
VGAGWLLPPTWTVYLCKALEAHKDDDWRSLNDLWVVGLTSVPITVIPQIIIVATVNTKNTPQPVIPWRLTNYEAKLSEKNAPRAMQMGIALLMPTWISQVNCPWLFGGGIFKLHALPTNKGWYYRSHPHPVNFELDSPWDVNMTEIWAHGLIVHDVKRIFGDDEQK